MTITLPPLLSLLGIVFGGMACGFVAFYILAFFTFMTMDTGPDWICTLLWPGTILATIAGWYFLGGMA